jgi:hypothetical protein
VTEGRLADLIGRPTSPPWLADSTGDSG